MKWKKYKIIFIGKNTMNNKYYKLDGLTKKYDRDELLLID